MPPQTAIILDIETRNDTDLMALHNYKPKKEDEFPPLIYHLPCAIAIGAIDGEGRLLSVESLGSGLLGGDACELTQAFWEMVGHTGILITYNGRVFDLPVMELCAMRYGCAAPTYWAQGQTGFRYRYGKAHLDMFDIISNYLPTKGLTLSNLVQLLGYKGKDGISGADVQSYYDTGRLTEINAYCQMDIIRTYAVWLVYALISGRLTKAMHATALEAAKPFLDQIR